MAKKLTTEEFIIKAKLVHGDKYDYSLVEYIGTHKKIYIICPIHGEFWQEPSSHLSGNGCRKCYNEVRLIWGKESCQIESLKYKSRREFELKNRSAYGSALSHKWLDEICTHMKYIGNRFIRGIYSYKITYEGCKYAYSGLTFNFDKRHSQHIKGSEKNSISRCSVDKFCRNNSIELPMYEIAYEYMPTEIAKIKEYENLCNLKNEGYTILNEAKCGNTGGSTIYWKKENCILEAIKYKSRREFSIYSSGAYHSALVNKWMNEICAHMIPKQHIWTKKECLKFSLKCNSKKEFEKKHPKAYSSAYKHKWLDEICSHMISNYCIWEKEKCLELSLKCISRSEYQIKYRNSYSAAIRNNWLDEICSHMEELIHFWTKEECKKLALNCTSRNEFYTKYRNAYQSSRNNNWLDEMCLHMKELTHFWTKEECFELSLECSSRSDYSKRFNSSYQSSNRNNWLNEFFPKITL